MQLAEEILNVSQGTYLISVGQAGFILKSLSGQLLAIDLYLSDYVERLEGNMGYKRLLPKVLEPKDLDMDIIIATHPHGDHYDKDSMTEMMNNANTILIASKECVKIVKEQQLDDARVKYRAPGDSDEILDYRIDYVDCDHGEGAPDAFGIVIQVDGLTIYEVGDSCFREDYAKAVLNKYSNIDILIGPINGAYGNMDEEEFAKFIDIIKPQLAIPCHYGMFASHGGNPGRFYEIMKTNYPNQKFLLMRQGEIFKI